MSDIKPRPQKVFHTHNNGSYRVHMIGDNRWEWWTGETSYVFERMYITARTRNKYWWSMPNGQGRDTLRAAVVATARDHRIARSLCKAFAALASV